MSDNETKAPTEDVQMDAPAATTEETAPVAEASTSNEEAKPTEETKAEGSDEKETNGDTPAPAEAPAAEEEKDDNVVANDNEDGEDKPVSSKKPKSKNGAAPASSRRKAGGAASKAVTEGNHGSFKKGDIVLTVLKGYPAWPSIIVEGDEIPHKVARQKPSGGRHFCSMFFPTGDYAWSTAKQLTPLKQHEITAYLQAPSKKKKGELFMAYEIAEDPQDWLNGRAAGLEDQDMEGGEDEDELADEVDEEPEEGSKKRKRAPEKKATDTKAKKAKLEKLAKSKKSKDTVEDEDEAEAEAPEPVSKKAAAKPKSSKKKVDEPKEPEAGEEEEADPFADDPEAKKVKDWRHKLQRGFLGKAMPAADEMEGYNDLFTSIEEYDGMTVDYLAYSKIGKVMKKIAALTSIPDNEKFKFTNRATTMMSKWQTQVEQTQA